MRKGYPMIHARYPELPFLTFAFELESKDPSSILRSSQSVPMESTSLSHDSRYRNPHQVAAIIVPRIVYFLRKEQPSVNRALPPVGWHLYILLASALLVSSVANDLQDLRAALADDDCVCVRKDGGDVEAARALDVHEEGAGGGHEGLELMLASLTSCMLVGSRQYRVRAECVRGRSGVEKVNSENLVSC
jgi:hypothetical protein